MSYIYELHAHTSQVSHCGQASAERVVRNYIDARYNGIVITDHLNYSTFRKMQDASWDEKVDYFLSGYKTAVSTASELDKNFKVLFGAELRLENQGDNDYLIYGMTEDFLRQNPDIMFVDFYEMAKRIHDAGMLLVQAHPFREDMTISDWHVLDGIEVYNGNSSHNSNNVIADMWAQRHRLIKTSGSDYHGVWGMRPGGIRTKLPINDNADLLSVLTGGDYELL
ncbi:MAG: PHP domain-containing protein [Clostridia bacterium]|nr:PHP domain-containing protein [Clostridia bacterium]